MNRFKSVVLLFCAALGFASCDTEEVDEHTKGTMGEYKPIFSFTLNGQVRNTEDVEISWVNANSFEMIAKIRDEYSSYGLVEAKIRFSALMMGNYPWIGSLQPTDLSSSAQLKLPNVAFTYSTQNAPITVMDAGSASIKQINYASEYMHGTFEYTLYAPVPNDPNALPIPPLSIRDGKFSYVNYK